MGRYAEFLPRGLPITDIRKTPDTQYILMCGLGLVWTPCCAGCGMPRITLFALDSILRGKITTMHKIKKFSKSFFFHLLETLQKNGSDWDNSISKFIIKFRKRKIILFIFILCYLGINIDLVQLKFIFITVVEMLILGPHQDCVLSTLLSRAIEHTALSALSLLICSVAEKWFSKLGLGVYEV